MQAVSGVCDEGLRITALPAAKRRRHLVRHRVERRIERRDRHTTPSGTRSVKPRRPACCGAPASGTISPRKSRASSADSERSARSGAARPAVGGREADLDLQHAHEFVAALLEQRGGPLEDGAALVRRQRAGAKRRVGRRDRLLHLLARGQVDLVQGCSRYLSSTCGGSTPSTQRPAISRRASGRVGEGCSSRRLESVGGGCVTPASRRLRPAR